jgi:S-(hydroxymethyl)glutathione dehydrogenase/alcohol dehydrogenase
MAVTETTSPDAFPTYVSAAVTDGRGGLGIEQLSIDPPGEHEVAVEIRAAGVCRTDLESLRWGGHLVLGHEGAGVVRFVGAKVDLDVGQHVILNWAMPCASCYQCHSGRPWLCERRDDTDFLPATPRLNGRPIRRSFNLGTMCGLTVVPVQAVVPYEQDMPFGSAAVVGCAVMTGYGSVVNVAKVFPGSSVAVLGVGSVGLNVIQTARLAGARQVIALGRSPRRLKTAVQFGATDVIDTSLGVEAEQVRAMTAGRGADFAFECTGDPSLAAVPLALIRNGGTALQVSGSETVESINLKWFEWDKTYIAPLYGNCRPQVDIPAILGLYAVRRLEIDALISASYPIDRVAAAFDDLEAGRVTKAVIEFPAR